MYDLSLQVLLVIVTVFYRKCQWTLATRDLQGFLYMDNLKETQTKKFTNSWQIQVDLKPSLKFI